MALDAEVADLLKTQLITSVQRGAELNAMADRNLVQGLGVINSTLIQQHGGVADDATQYGSMQTASGVPKQGSLVNPS